MQALPQGRHFSMRLSINSPSHLSHRQQCVTDQPHWSIAWTHCTRIEGNEHSQHWSTHVDLFELPSFKINTPSGAFIQQYLSCDSSPRDTGGESGHISEESQTSDLLYLTFSFSCPVFCHRRALLPQHG